MHQDAKRDMKRLANPVKAAFFPRFFKTGPGQYGEGDIFWGVTVPQVRKMAKVYKTMTLSDIEVLLHDPVHEVRLLALIILSKQYESSEAGERNHIVRLYLKNRMFVNNWDLVDVSAHKILGRHLLANGHTAVLDKLAASGHLWSQRIAMIATFAFIRDNKFNESLHLAEYFLTHKHDLIHKASGWMLREIGKRDSKMLEQFLLEHKYKMPRTMLRYAIEQLNKNKRDYYLSAKLIGR